MKPVLVTQRVEIVPDYGERRDALDQMWASFLERCGFFAVPIPNHLETALRLAASVNPAGLLLTGGNDLSAYSGNASERDKTEHALIDWCRERSLPIMGVCRGLQVLANRFGVGLTRLEAHSGRRHLIRGKCGVREVNSFHHWGPRLPLVDELVVDYVSDDGVVEGFHHCAEKMAAIMWHPEREKPFDERDVEMIARFFASSESSKGA